MRLHRFLLTLCGLSAFLALTVLQAAHADSRDDWLASLNDRAERLAAIDPDRIDTFRETAIILAEELNRFTVEETEIRKNDKVPPPEGAIRRPGQTVENDAQAEVLLDADAGSPVPLSAVPNTWFNYHVTEANRLLTQLIAKVGDARNGTTPSADLHAIATSLERMLDRLNRPPKRR